DSFWFFPFSSANGPAERRSNCEYRGADRLVCPHFPANLFWPAGGARKKTAVLRALFPPPIKLSSALLSGLDLACLSFCQLGHPSSSKRKGAQQANKFSPVLGSNRWTRAGSNRNRTLSPVSITACASILLVSNDRIPAALGSSSPALTTVAPPPSP